MTTTQAEPLTRYIRQVAATHLAADLSDRQLLERYAGHRDEAAFTALVRRHGPLVLGVCRRVLGDAHAAEDAFQATFLVLARRAGAVGRPEALGPWLHGVAARVALKARGREARRRAAEGRAAALAPTAAGTEDPVWHDLRPLLDEAIGALPDKLRTPFVLHYLEGRTVMAIARRLGCPRGTVATHLARARQRLRTRLLRRGVTLSATALGVALSRQPAAAALAPALPGTLLKAAVGFGAGPAAGVVPAGITALAQGGLQAMSLSKQAVLAVALLLTLGAVGGTVILAQGTATREPGDKLPGISPAPAAAETDLALFREGGKRFLTEDYRGADRSFSELLERFPESPLASQAAKLAITAKHMTTTKEDGVFPLEQVREGRRIIGAVLAGAKAAEAGQERAGRRQESVSAAVRNKRQADRLLQQYSAAFKAGKYAEAERYAAAALALDPNNAAAAAAWELAHSPRHQAERREKARRKEEKIDLLLREASSWNVNDVPLRRWLDDVRNAHGVNLIIDHPALEQAGISLDRPLTVRLEGVSLRTALDLTLRSVGLAYVVKDGVIVVTTPTAARGRPVTATYQVADLVGGYATADAVIRLIVRTIAPESWDERGGSATIDYFPLGKALVVKQTPDVQEQIADFLAALRRLKGAEKKKQP